MKVPEAWERLRIEGNSLTPAEDLTYGSSNVILAVLDQGAIPKNPIQFPDFNGEINGTAINGSLDKVYKVYDFLGSKS